MTIRHLGAQLRSHQVTCTELVERALAAAKQREDLGAFITITETQAHAEAAERDRELHAGTDRGPLHGIPIALKDLIYTKGVHTTGGSLLYREFVPEHDADVVIRLCEAGAVSIGKTNLHELAFGVTSLNPHFGPVKNPLNEKRLAGGSSGGSAAAIAAGIVPLTLGSDTGGSIRIPASYCGIVGLKPTYEIVSRRGVLPLAFTLDHVGPMGLCVEDCALAMNALAKEEAEYNLPELADLKGVRVGVPRNFFFERVEEDVASAVHKALGAFRDAGAELVDVELPDFAELNTISHMIIMAEFAALHTEQREHTHFGSDVWSLLEQGRMVSGHEYINAQRLRAVFCEQVAAIWNRIEVLATPTTPITAPYVVTETIRLDGTEETVRAASTRLVRAINCLGIPALSMPCGKGQDGMPVGLQLMSAAHTDARLLQVAKCAERLLSEARR